MTSNDFLDDIERELDLNEIYDNNVSFLVEKLLDLGVFSDEHSLKLYLAIRPIQDLKCENESYPITYEKGYDEESVVESITSVSSDDDSYFTQTFEQ